VNAIPQPPVEFVEVAVPLPVYQCYTYQVPGALRSAVEVGKRVLVPFGRRRLTAYVMGPPSTVPKDKKIKSIIDVLDERPLFPIRMAPFFCWLADYYIHPIGEVIQTALPAGLTVADKTVYLLTDQGRGMLDAGTLKKPFRRLFSLMKTKPRHYDQLARASKGHLLPSQLKRWVDSGWIVKETVLGRQRARCRTQRFISAESVVSGSRPLSPQRQKLMAVLQERGAVALPDLKRQVPSAARLVRAMARDGQVRIENRVVHRDLLGEPIAPDHAPELTAEQAAAVTAVKADFGRGFNTFLLAGITGSGKTEVYLHLAAEACKREMPVLVLVPEIALVSQMERAFRARFGDRLALLHSGLSAGERYDQWRRIAEGDRLIAIGARSAIFAPFQRLGLVIVDEEHDDSYKQEGALRYNARDLAVVRARTDGAIAILGSATPSLQSTHNVSIGKYRQIRLRERIDQRTLPAVTVQDLNSIREERGVRRFLTPQLVEAIQDTLSKKEQVLLFLNRRGFANILLCSDCGGPMRCDRCDVSLTYHHNSNAYQCHYCGSRRAASASCSHCGSSQIRRLGLGTEKLEVEIQNRFPQACVERMDRDTTRRKGAIIQLLRRLRERKIDILVGTQMVAKGHDYPHITLVGIVCADLSLSMPDFRAGERTFQLLAQVAGRAGRGRSPGRVILQTYNPQHFSIAAARNQDYDAFYRQEIRFRRMLGYPPFSRMIQIRIQGKDDQRTSGYAKQLARHCNSLSADQKAHGGVDVLGPIEAPLPKIADYFRWQILLKSTRADAVHRFARNLLFSPQSPPKSRGISVGIDVDPLFLM
jgi:primosomal protein N' (replication factor Y)